MEGLDNMYLMFTADGLRFLMPLARVQRVEEQKADPGELPVLKFAELIAGHEAGSEQRYIILTESGGEQFGILVEEVLGICAVEADQIRALPRAVRTEANSYLGAVVPVEKSGTMAYILDPSVWEKKNKARRESAWTI